MGGHRATLPITYGAMSSSVLKTINFKNMTHEEFQEKVKAIPDQELAEMAQKTLSKLCSTGGQSFTMTVPPRIDDTDIILSEVIKRFEVLAFVTA